MNSTPILDKTEMLHIIDECDVCYMGLVDEDMPYVLPFNFAIDGETLYLHSAPEGRKMDVLRKNNQVCITFSTGHKMYFQNENVACSWGMLFKSVITWGKVEFITDLAEKEKCLNLFMMKYSGKTDFSYSLPSLKNVNVMKIQIDKMTGKKRGY